LRFSALAHDIIRNKVLIAISWSVCNTIRLDTDEIDMKYA